MPASPTGLTLDPHGYFSRNNARFVPVGVNYWPASAGVDMWQLWPEAEIQRDLDLVAALGLNTVRFFLRWPDFEPALGQFNPLAFDRLGRLMSFFRDRNLLAQPSLIVGGMSGGHFWPAWKQNRNLYSDPLMLERSAALATHAARILAPFHPWIAGIDYGNELDGVDQTEPSHIRHWCQTFASAIRAEYPHALLVSGVSGGPLSNDSPWRYHDDLGADFLSYHHYPAPHWNSLRIDGLADPFAHAQLPHGVSAVRSYGPVMLQEFGTLVTGGAAPQEAYLRAVLPAAWNAGANGFLWWCLRDVRSRAYNYVRCGMESTLGLVDSSGRVKPGLQPFIDFAQTVGALPTPARDHPTAIYWPKHFYNRENPAGVGNNPSSVHNRSLAAAFALRSIDVPFTHVRGGQPFSAHVKTIIIPGSHLDADEAQALATFVTAGGRLLWHAPYWSEWGHDQAALLGAYPADFCLQKKSTLPAFGQSWPFEPWHTPENTRLALALHGATVVDADDTGFPLLFRHTLGQGRVLFCLASVEEAILNALSDPPLRNRWPQWYRGALALLAD